jgi:hypothetical protein
MQGTILKIGRQYRSHPVHYVQYTPPPPSPVYAASMVKPLFTNQLKAVISSSDYRLAKAYNGEMFVYNCEMFLCLFKIQSEL